MARVLPLEPKLKPLVAQLGRLKMGEFLHSEEFDHIVLEQDWDVLWHRCKKEIRQQGNVHRFNDRTVEQDAFAIMLNAAYSHNVDALEVVLTTTISAFVSWKSGPLDLNGLCASVRSFPLSSACQALLEHTAELSKQKQIDMVEGHSLPDKMISKEVEMGKKVFVVHGHDEARRRELCSLLKADLGLEPVVVQEEPNDSIETILGKIERLAAQCHVAVILMTGDDEMKSGSMRARQNVVLELGYFLGLWRGQEQRKIIVIQAPNVETPSDISGVVYLPYKTTVEEIFLKLKRQLKHWGVEVD